MKSFELILLGAIWGASFLLMRIASQEFGPLPLTLLRVGIAAFILAPVLQSATARRQFRSKLKPLFVVGLTSFALPFSLLAYSTLYLNAGFASILNATEALWTALIATIGFQTHINRHQVMGLLLGPIGIAALVWHKLNSNALNIPVAIGAALLATFFYGYSVNYSKRHLDDIEPLVVTFGSQFLAAIFLLPFALLVWPKQPIAPSSWLCILTLGIVCTGFAFFLFFRLIKHTGANYAASVTFLIPVFGVIWGMIFLGEKITPLMVLGCTVILMGTALANKKIG